MPTQNHKRDVLRSRAIDISLESHRAATFFVVTVMLSALVLAAASARVALPAQLADSNNVEHVRIAAKLDPQNDTIQEKLGLLELVSGDFVQARAHLERAISLNPNDASHWRGLAPACYIAADLACAGESYDRAVQLAPMRPVYVWERATYLAVNGYRDRALAGYSRFVQLSPEQSDAAFKAALQLTDDPKVVWNSVAKPAGTKAQLALLTLLANHGQGEQTSGLWADLVNAALPNDGLRAYSEALVQHRDFALAERVWRRVERTDSFPADHSTNLIYNSEFHFKPTNSGFDWHLAPRWFMETAVETKDGRSALRITFTVAHNEDSEPVYEFVPVTPNQGYVLSAGVKADNITSPSGPRLRVIDAECTQCLDVMSEPILGTGPWHKAEVAFSTAATTKVVRISVMRRHARAFPMDITGTVWVTGFELAAKSLVATASAGEQPQ